MAIGKIIQMLLRSAGGKKAAAKLYKQARKEIPHKSPGTAGVKTGPMERKWSGRSPAVIRAMKRPQPGMVRGEYPKPPRDAYGSLVGNRGLGYQSDSPFGFSPLKRQIASRLSRRDPGMARGLGRMQSRKASALNTPGTPFEGRALRYEPSPTNLRARQLMGGAKSAKELDFMKFVASMEKRTGMKMTKKSIGMLRKLFNTPGTSRR